MSGDQGCCKLKWIMCAVNQLNLIKLSKMSEHQRLTAFPGTEFLVCEHIDALWTHWGKDWMLCIGGTHYTFPCVYSFDYSWFLCHKSVIISIQYDKGTYHLNVLSSLKKTGRLPQTYTDLVRISDVGRALHSSSEVKPIQTPLVLAWESIQPYMINARTEWQ